MSEERSGGLIIKLYAYEVASLEEATLMFVKSISQIGLEFSLTMPSTKRKVITVPISPHKHKDAQEQFIRETHRRVINIFNISPHDLESLKSLRIPNTAGLKLKTSF